MLDVFLSFFSAFAAEWKLRSLANRILITLPDGTCPSKKQTLKALRMGEVQAQCRQAYGLLSGGGFCVVSVGDDENITVTPQAPRSPK